MLVKVKLQIKGKQFPQTAEIDEIELSKIEGQRMTWWNEYTDKKGNKIRHKHITINDPDAVIQDIEYLDNDQDEKEFYNGEIPE